jgi:biopolymer transport protein ExbD
MRFIGLLTLLSRLSLWQISIYPLVGISLNLLTFIYLTSLLDTYDVNVSPDKRTILLHNEGNLILALKVS